MNSITPGGLTLKEKLPYVGPPVDEWGSGAQALRANNEKPLPHFERINQCP